MAIPLLPTNEMRLLAKAGPTDDPMLPDSVDPRAKMSVKGAHTNDHQMKTIECKCSFHLPPSSTSLAVSPPSYAVPTRFTVGAATTMEAQYRKYARFDAVSFMLAVRLCFCGKIGNGLDCKKRRDQTPGPRERE